jgi:electron transfer flavoprotein alpha subunit
MSGILIWAETRDGELRKIALETAYCAITLSEKLAIPASALIINAHCATRELTGLGFQTIYEIENAALASYSSEGFVTALNAAVQASQADIILMGATALGRDLSGRLAAKLDAALATDVIKLDVNGSFKVIRPVYSGKLLAEVELLASPKVISLRPNVFPKAEIKGGNSPIESLKIEELLIRTQIKQAIQAAQGVMDVTEAQIIVSGGRGVGGSEGFKMLEELAKDLGGALGASRAAVDAGWIPYKHQVGQTGKVVSPVLYIACGISGAIQHFAGMGSAKFIIAINTDPDAPVMHKANFAIEGDLFKIIPLLRDELKKVLKK